MRSLLVACALLGCLATASRPPSRLTRVSTAQRVSAVRRAWPLQSAASTHGAELPQSQVQRLVEAAAPAVALVLPTMVRNQTMQGTAFRVLRSDFVEDGSVEDGSSSDTIPGWCWLVTAAHVTLPGCILKVQFPGSPVTPAELHGRAADDVDLALIRISAADLPQSLWPEPLRFRPSLARVGESVIGLGYPGGILGPAASLGIVCAHAAALNATMPAAAIALDAREAAAPTYVATDAALAGGMSGGPLLGFDGNVLGVNVLLRADLRALGNFAIAAPRVIESVRALFLAPARAEADPTAAWQVFLFNDRMNTKQRVATVLKESGFSTAEADAVMSEAHTRGRAVVRTFAPPNASESAATLRDALRVADLLVEAEQVAAVAA
ncbi:trypsin-like cysteine/serine peptidase domain-containing protein [Pavlovales sp. CCMP2436]|nr:trypsin-like cysteine/serine peptidase domain-containing protein [Pavlovales sp. CCMP2436]|eukprot:CAMPEP_0179983074 /NCGR_PEP_ID=MMETSP0984-20121128/336_1 /TAXON_ID=483367 /ORGANISM="non described non described, Strain CCMP 2436" /LENGTH=380 /DNA_ID=CAMNT_0021901431 /DNA_START=1232 /DNA_END=2374 /DNA_ORIENTATION=-